MDSAQDGSQMTSSEVYVAHGLLEAYRRGIADGAIPTEVVPGEMIAVERLAAWVGPLIAAGEHATSDEWSGVLDYDLFDGGAPESEAARMYNRAVMLSLLGFAPTADLADALVRGVLPHSEVTAAGSRRLLCSLAVEARWTDRCRGVAAHLGAWSDEGGAVRVFVWPESFAPILASGEMPEVASEQCNSVAEVEAAVRDIEALLETATEAGQGAAALRATSMSCS